MNAPDQGARPPSPMVPGGEGMMPPEVRAHFEALLYAHPLLCADYVVWNPDAPGHGAVLCKCCGHRIVGDRLIGNPDQTVLEDAGEQGERVILLTQRVKMTALPNYAEYLIVFEDGDKHIVAICADCGVKPKGLDEIAALYAAEMLVMAEDFRRHNPDVDVAHRFFTRMALKVPVIWRPKRRID